MTTESASVRFQTRESRQHCRTASFLFSLPMLFYVASSSLSTWPAIELTSRARRAQQLLLKQNSTRTQRRVSARRPLVRVVDRARATRARSHLISLLHLHARSTLPRAHACSSFNDCRTAILIDGTCAQTFTCLEGRCCCCCGDRRRRRRRCRRPNNIINVDKTGECACSFPIVE